MPRPPRAKFRALNAAHRKARPRPSRSARSPPQNPPRKSKRPPRKVLRKPRKPSPARKLRRHRFAWLRLCVPLCRQDKVLRRPPCRYRMRLPITRLHPLRALLRRRRLLFLCRRVRYPGVRRFPPSRCLLRARVRFYRDHGSLFRPASARLRKLLPPRPLREPLRQALRGHRPRACPAFPRLLVRRLCGQARLPLRRPLRSRCARLPNRILPDSLKPGPSFRLVPTWWRD